MSNYDERCCGTGVCIINSQGQCWCGQVWDGNKMVAPTLKPLIAKPQSNNDVESEVEVDKDSEQK